MPLIRIGAIDGRMKERGVDKLTFECLASIRANMLSRKDQRHGR